MDKRTIIRVKERVIAILEEEPATRNSDDKLYVRVCQQILGEKNVSRPFFWIMANRDALGLPPYESVSRARRRVQQERISLRATEAVTEERYNREEVFREVYGSNEG